MGAYGGNFSGLRFPGYEVSSLSLDFRVFGANLKCKCMWYMAQRLNPRNPRP